MKKAVVVVVIGAMLVGAGVGQARAGDREWAVAGKVLTGLIVLDALTSPCYTPVVYERPVYYHTPPAVYQPAVVYQPPVVYTPPVVYPRPVVYYSPPPYYHYGSSVHFTVGRTWRPVCRPYRCWPRHHDRRHHHYHGHHHRRCR